MPPARLRQPECVDVREECVPVLEWEHKLFFLVKGTGKLRDALLLMAGQTEEAGGMIIKRVSEIPWAPDIPVAPLHLTTRTLEQSDADMDKL